jgi:hypothetical protein
MLYKDDVTQAMISQLEKSIINNDNGIGLPYWSAKNPLIVRNFTFVLVSLNFGKVIATSKYSRFEFNIALLDSKELINYRFNKKMSKFLMRENTEQKASNLVKVNKTVVETGLNRPGFAKAAKNPFRYDVDMLMQYFTPIKQNIIKSMTKAAEKGTLNDEYFIDPANYEEVATYCLTQYCVDNTYNLEYNISDQRGRSIYNASKRVGNPIANKDFRALLVAPAILVHRANKEQMGDIYYFIAELLGSKATTERGKIAQGMKWYRERKLPKLDLDTEHDRSELHELIWLTRIYDRLTELYSKAMPFIRWDIPLEIDASMSIAQIVGALTNEKRLLERTNVIGSTLSDPWYIEGVRRLAAKAVGTPVFYGSSQSATTLIKSKGLISTNEEIAAIRKEFATGGLAVMKLFKDALIQNYNVQTPTLQINIMDDTFTVTVNKFKQAGARIVITEAWNGKKYQRSFTHEPILIPDYSRMKLFWATCLIHNLDSQIMDKIANATDEWMLTIHDAAIVLPGTARRTRKAYALQLKEVNNRRNSILTGFRQSIGATTLKADVAFMKLHAATTQAEDVSFNTTAMK